MGSGRPAFRSQPHPRLGAGSRWGTRWAPRRGRTPPLTHAPRSPPPTGKRPALCGCSHLKDPVGLTPAWDPVRAPHRPRPPRFPAPPWSGPNGALQAPQSLEDVGRVPRRSHAQLPTGAASGAGRDRSLLRPDRVAPGARVACSVYGAVRARKPGSTPLGGPTCGRFQCPPSSAPAPQQAVFAPNWSFLLTKPTSLPPPRRCAAFPTAGDRGSLPASPAWEAAAPGPPPRPVGR